MHRRNFVRLVGGGAVFATLAGCATAGPGTAWTNPGAGEGDPRRRAIAWGILAPNPHNMQPWLLDLRTADEALVYVDEERLLPQTDPLNRQIVVGTGAFLELMRMASAREGQTIGITPFPDGEPQTRLDRRPLAHLRFSKGPTVVDPLFSEVLKRRTNRNPFRMVQVPATAADAIRGAAAAPAVKAFVTVAQAELEPLRRLAAEGVLVEAATPAAHKESNDRTFFGEADIAAHPYGVSVHGPMVEAAHALGLLNQRAVETPGSFAYRQLIAFLTQDAQTAQGFLWLTTDGNSRSEQLSAGAAYLRANLAATGLGIAMHPFSQVLQEYPSMRATFDKAHRTLAPHGGRVQMFARLGYADNVPAAPKRGVDAQILRS